MVTTILLILVTLILLTGAGYFLFLFAQIARAEPPAIETHWGGFGGGLGGIRFSASIVYLGVALILCAMAMMVMPRPRGDSSTEDASPSASSASASTKTTR